uniref:Uncharacterized protein n=1 Tax=Gossypium raimondii TaxID=29730 RepID=A0A0D2UXU9_GOSRA|nr:hypothetical protein B456_011G250700 [Gossypium raimondii]
MDERLRTAARTGNVTDLYNLIQRDGNVLRHFDEVEFVDTHIAAEEGCISPLHIAVKQGHKEMALRFLEMDNDLVRVKGKNGKTPLHFLSEAGNHDGMLDRILEICPQCIQYVPIENRNALHIAVENNRLDVLQLKLLLNCKADKHANNQAGWTLMDVAQQQHNRESITILRGCFIPEVSNFKCKLEKQIVKHVAKASSLIFHNLDNISG